MCQAPFANRVVGQPHNFGPVTNGQREVAGLAPYIAPSPRCPLMPRPPSGEWDSARPPIVTWRPARSNPKSPATARTGIDAGTGAARGLSREELGVADQGLHQRSQSQWEGARPKSRADTGATGVRKTWKRKAEGVVCCPIEGEGTV